MGGAGPDQPAGGVGEDLHVQPVPLVLARVVRPVCLGAHADPVDGDQGAVQDHVRLASGGRHGDGQVRSFGGEQVDQFGDVPVRRSRRPAGCRCPRSVGAPAPAALPGNSSAADRDAAAPGRVVGQGAPTELGCTGQRVGDAFDEAERGGRSAQGAGEQAGSSAVGISCPTSARKLAVPMPAIPRVSQGASAPGAGSVPAGVVGEAAGSVIRAVSPPRDDRPKRRGETLRCEPLHPVVVGPTWLDLRLLIFGC